MNRINQFKHRIVNELAWVMNSPNLISSPAESSTAGLPAVVSDERCQSIYQNNLEWLKGLDAEPEHLVDTLQARKHNRLGYYFEDLLSYWIEHTIAKGYFESHVQVNSGKRSIGEFDFLFKSELGYEHWEAAVKFYLYTQDVDGQISWYGPNANDTLAKKIEKLSTHQARLGELEDSKDLLAQRHIGQLQPAIFMKGYLFYPPGTNRGELDKEVNAYPLSDNHLTGWWIKENQLDQLDTGIVSGQELRWRILPRLQWLSPACYSVNEVDNLLRDCQQISTGLREHFQQSQDSRLVVGYGLNEAGQWQERSRGFVVASTWPGKAG